MCSIWLLKTTHAWLTNLEGTWSILLHALVTYKEVKPYSVAFGSEGLHVCQLHWEFLCGHERPAPSLLASSIVCIMLQSGFGIITYSLSFSCEKRFTVWVVFTSSLGSKPVHDLTLSLIVPCLGIVDSECYNLTASVIGLNWSFSWLVQTR